ncbi:amidase [Chania multitudinisentens RB-25]|uniref:Amidase n=1 Tax=Chania multitudinisentens RB-25 TaxID=1441930 RepID=W0L3R9_9GAMM|nr:amidase [Chania multitudinisentens]AHG18378.1 amidase [Chania multitudinisentens RB-25]
MDEKRLAHSGNTHDASYFAAQFRQGIVTPSDLLEQALALAKTLPEVFISLLPERARREAADATLRWQRGAPLSPLDGIPIAWKDLFDLAGSLTTAGSPTRLASPQASADAAIVSRLQAAGLVSLGKTNLSEFAYSGLGLNPYFGTPAIYDRHGIAHVPGGSSSGAGCAVKLGVVPIAMGTDTAGSVRIPAAFTGLIGYRSSRQRYSRHGVFPLAQSLDTLGPICRSVRDALALDRLLADAPAKQPTIPPHELVLRVDSEILNDQSVEPCVRQNLLEMLDKLTVGGVQIDLRPVATLHQSLRWIAQEGWPGAVEALALHRPLLEGSQAAHLDPRVHARLIAAGALPADLPQRFLQQRAHWQRQIRAELNGALLVTPTVAHVAPALAPLENDADLFARINLATLRLTMPGSLLDMPGIAMPTGQDQHGLATSLLLSLPTGDDQRLLNMALSIEQHITRQD